MTKSWHENAWEDYLFWQMQDKQINLLLKDIERNPYDAIGKPEALSGNLSGYWSKRIDDKNRIVYKIEHNQVLIAQCGSHYRDK